MHIGFLGYGEDRTRLIGELRSRGHRVAATDERIDALGSFDRVVSFGYRYILGTSVLATARHPVMNLHIGLLPFNKGAHPNFWAWAEETPHGVTLHEMTKSVDAGPIVAQRRVAFHDDRMTLRESHDRLVAEIEDLFLETVDSWLRGETVAVPQKGEGTSHRTTDLPRWMSDWNMPARDAVERYRGAG